LKSVTPLSAVLSTNNFQNVHPPMLRPLTSPPPPPPIAPPPAFFQLHFQNLSVYILPVLSPKVRLLLFGRLEFVSLLLVCIRPPILSIPTFYPSLPVVLTLQGTFLLPQSSGGALTPFSNPSGPHHLDDLLALFRPLSYR